MAAGEVPPTDPTNADTAPAWNGDDGEYWAAHDRRFDRGISRYHAPLLDAAAIDPDDSVVDIGCGTGQVTRDVARRVSTGSVLGLDVSLPMLEVARRHAEEEGITNARFEAADAQIHAFAAGAFDVAISRAGVMFFGDPVAAFANIRHALQPNARIALLVWQARELNTWVVAFAEALAAGRPVPVPPPGAPSPLVRVRGSGPRALCSNGLGSTNSRSPGSRNRCTSAPTPTTPTDSYGAWDSRSSCSATSMRVRRTTPSSPSARSIDAHATDAGVLFPAAAWIVTARNAAG